MLFTQENQNQVVKIKLDFEKIFLIIFFGLFLYLESGFLFDNRLQHDYPYAYLASDAFQHQTRAESIKDAGNYKNEASYIVFGFNGAIGYYPPVLYDLSVILSDLAGLEIYDTVYFLVFFFAAIGTLMMYFVIRQFNRNVAIIAIPISLLVFSNGLYTGFTWGHWPAIVSQAFLVCIFWCTSKIDLEKSYLFLAVFMSASFMTHTSEVLFAAIYLIIFFIAYSIIFRKIDLKLIKNFVIGGIICLIILFYYLVIFKYVWLPRQAYEFAVQKMWDNPTMYLSDFKIFFLLMIAGIAIALFYIKKSFVPAVMALSMLIIGSGNYFGFREKAFQLRFFWPVLLCFFIGFAIYWLLKLIIKEWKPVYSFILSIIIILAILVNSVPFVPHYNPIKTNGIMDPYHWEMFRWIEKNTAKESNVYFFYGDIYSQDAVLRSAKRTHSQVIPEDYVDALSKREIRRFYDTESPGDHGGGVPYRTSFFSFGSRLEEAPPGFLHGKRDICNYDYYVFDKISGQPVLAQYNLLIASELQKNGSATVVFENPTAVIMKNNKKGEDCIEQRSF